MPVALATSSRVGSSNESSSAGGSSGTEGGGAAKQSPEVFVVHQYKQLRGDVYTILQEAESIISMVLMCSGK